MQAVQLTKDTDTFASIILQCATGVHVRRQLQQCQAQQFALADAILRGREGDDPACLVGVCLESLRASARDMHGKTVLEDARADA